MTLTNTSFNHDWKNLINTLHVIDLSILPSYFIQFFFVREIEILLDFFIILYDLAVSVVPYWPPKIIWNFTRTDELENVSQLNTEKCRHCIVYYTIPTTAAAYITFFSWNRNHIGYIMLLYTSIYLDSFFNISYFFFRTKSVGFDETEFGAGISGCVQ